MLTAALVTIALGGCSSDSTGPEPRVAVQVAAARRIDLRRTVTAEAMLFPLAQAILAPKVSAPVKRFLVNRGAHVHRGQLLAELENRDLKATAAEDEGLLDEARANYLSTKAGTVPEAVRKAELDVTAARAALSTQQKLYDSRDALFAHGAISQRDLDQANLALAQARTQYELAKKHLDTLKAVGREQILKGAEGQLEAARGKYEVATTQLAYSEIKSPVDGVVTDRPLYPGEMARAGTPLITVMDISSMIARAHVPEQAAFLVRVGDPATIAAAEDRDLLPGRVTVVGPALDPNSTTVEIRVQALNPKEVLRPGMTVHLSIVVATEPSALVVPESALITATDGRTTVVVSGADGRAHTRVVRTGLHEGGEVQILAGLQAGERVVTTGAYGLPDNTKLRVEPVSPAS